MNKIQVSVQQRERIELEITGLFSNSPQAVTESRQFLEGILLFSDYLPSALVSEITEALDKTHAKRLMSELLGLCKQLATIGNMSDHETSFTDGELTIRLESGRSAAYVVRFETEEKGMAIVGPKTLTLLDGKTLIDCATYLDLRHKPTLFFSLLEKLMNSMRAVVEIDNRERQFFLDQLKDRY